jgi:hypothetical protein
MPLLRRLLASALVVVSASALCVCAALASARPLVAKRQNPKLAIVHRALAPVAKLAPGDSAQRVLELRYRGRGRFAAVVLRVRGFNHSLLGSGSAGLRLTIERCSKKWTKNRRTRTYWCHGKRRVVLGARAIGSRQPFRLRRLSARAGRTDHLRVTVGLPLRAGNELQHRVSRLVYAFTGVAR